MIQSWLYPMWLINGEKDVWEMTKCLRNDELISWESNKIWREGRALFVNEKLYTLGCQRSQLAHLAICWWTTVHLIYSYCQKSESDFINLDCNCCEYSRIIFHIQLLSRNPSEPLSRHNSNNSDVYKCSKSFSSHSTLNHKTMTFQLFLFLFQTFSF